MVSQSIPRLEPVYRLQEDGSPWGRTLIYCQKYILNPSPSLPQRDLCLLSEWLHGGTKTDLSRITEHRLWSDMNSRRPHHWIGVHESEQGLCRSDDQHNFSSTTSQWSQWVTKPILWLLIQWKAGSQIQGVQFRGCALNHKTVWHV